MSLGNLDLAAISSRAIGETSESIRTATALIHPALDAINASIGEASSRVMEYASEHFNFISILALAGILCHVATPLMRTMVPLRISFIFSDLFFIGYGALSGSYITLSLYMLLLPINSMRLYQMLRLVKKARVSAQGDKSMNWLKPFTTQRKYSKGDVLFHKGDPANEMFFTVTGKLLVTEIGVELPPGRLVGELGFLSPNNRRTMTVECIESGEVLTITYDKLLEICFQNPEFGYYFLRVSSQRLLEHIAHLEGIIDQNKYAANPTSGPPKRVVPAEIVNAPVTRQHDEGGVIPGLSTWA